ncbi:isoprenyl transferase [bacterium]|nr:isoprenyl transferase [bacterium]
MKQIPQHIAIIMDGNGRWASQKGMDRLSGHCEGAKTAERIVENCIDREIKYLTLYTFSSENWVRPDDEVKGLMQLLCEFLDATTPKMLERSVRFRAIGEISKLPPFVIDKIKDTTEKTAKGGGLTLILALSYGSRQEICSAVEKIIQKGIKKITPELIDQNLFTEGIPDPDLLIRTSGEYRVSNFLLWQLSYTELYFADVLWPDFCDKDLGEAIESYQNRDRRFGGI